VRRWGGRALAAAVVWGLLVGYAALSERSVRPVALAAAVAAVLAVGWLCTDTFLVDQPPRWQLYRPSNAWRTYDPRFARLSQEIAEAPDRRAAAAAVHASLMTIADGLLLDKYGVDRAGDPEAARRILGESLTSYLRAGPGKDRDIFSPRVSAALDRLESL